MITLLLLCSVGCRIEFLPSVKLMFRVRALLRLVRKLILKRRLCRSCFSWISGITRLVSSLLSCDCCNVLLLVELIAVFYFQKTKFYVTVVLSKLSPGERWWFHGCTSCGKTTIPYGASYRCPDMNCGATGGGPR